MTTRWPGRSSSSVNVRPRAGATHRVENKFAETREPGITRASSPFILLKSRSIWSEEASESNVWFRCRQSKKLGYEVRSGFAPAGFVGATPGGNSNVEIATSCSEFGNGNGRKRMP